MKKQFLLLASALVIGAMTMVSCGPKADPAVETEEAVVEQPAPEAAPVAPVVEEPVVEEPVVEEPKSEEPSRKAIQEEGNKGLTAAKPQPSKEDASKGETKLTPSRK